MESDRESTIDFNKYLYIAKIQAKKYYEYVAASERIAYGVEDFEQEGRVAIWRAADDFDPSRGTKFTTWAFERVKYACLDLLEKTYPMSKERWSMVKELDKSVDNFQIRYGRKPFYSELVEITGLKEERISEIESFKIKKISFSTQEGNEDEGEGLKNLYLDQIAVSQPTQEQDLEKKEAIECLDTLNEIEKRTLVFNAMEGYSQEETGQILGKITPIDKRRISETRKKAEEKLYRRLRR